MAYNVPGGVVKNLSFGPGILYITAGVAGAGATATPNIDIGYARGATFAAQRGKLDVYQGSPRSYITTFAQEETVTLQATGLEWNLANLAILMGAGTVSGTNFDFGGGGAFTEVGLRYLHRTPNGGTVDLSIWRAQGQGELSLNFNDELQEFNYQFRALVATTNWQNVNLAQNGNLFRISYTQGP
jgi:hypothetical protein